MATLTTLVTFSAVNGANGSLPSGPLLADANGNLFGTTFGGGASNYGVVFEIPKDGSIPAGYG